MDIEGLLKSFREHKVEFVVIGATAFPPLVAGVTFPRVWRNKIKARFGKTETHFASLDDLIAMKRAAGRPKDKEDLKHLLRLKERSS